MVAEAEPGSDPDSEADFQGLRSVRDTHVVSSTLFPS